VTTKKGSTPKTKGPADRGPLSLIIRHKIERSLMIFQGLNIGSGGWGSEMDKKTKPVNGPGQGSRERLQKTRKKERNKLGKQKERSPGGE